MSRSRFSSPARAPSAFLNRDEQLDRVTSHIATLGGDAQHFAVFEITGIGGMGKTRLLDELRQRATTAESCRVLWVSLEAEAAATETGPMRVLREQLDFDCLLFDVALVAYWAATGQPLDRPPPGRLTRSWAFKTADASRSVTGIPLPLTFAVDAYRAMGRSVARRRRYSKEEFEAIDGLRGRPTELRERLPHYLGEDIKRMAEVSGARMVVFWDAYDRQSPQTLQRRAPWLRELIGSMDRGVHLVASRESLRWDPGDWADLTHAVTIGELPEDEARTLIHQRFSAVSPAVEDHLLRSSGRIPFVLLAALDACALAAEHGPVRVEDLPADADETIRYLLEHLPDAQRAVAVALASVQLFDRALYHHLIRALHLPSSVLDFDDFVQWFFIEEVQPGVHKTHDLLSESIRASADRQPNRDPALAAATEHLALRVADGTAGEDAHVPMFLAAALAGWQQSTGIPPASAETLIDVVYVLNDGGMWHELRSIARLALTARDPKLRAVAHVAQALADRRLEGAEQALADLENLDSIGWSLGRHQRTLEIEVGYLTEILGNYARAREMFRELDDLERFDPRSRPDLRARLYNADMLAMDGRLRTAARLLLEAHEALGPAYPWTWAELVRHRAHALRFSFLPDQAHAQYLNAMRAAADAPALLGKLQTNVAETLCRTQPAEALEAAALSLEVNERLGNRIELAKAHAARSIALATLHEPHAAVDSARLAADLARSAAYPAGVAFALQAQAIAATLAGQEHASRAALSALNDTVGRLGTYRHLVVLPAAIAGDLESVQDVLEETEWVMDEHVRERLRALGG